MTDPTILIVELSARARRAAQALPGMDSERKRAGLRAAAAAIRDAGDAILAANADDLSRGNELTAAMRDRLRLGPDRLAGIAEAVEAVAALDDPVGAEIDRRERPNGLLLSRVRVPIGVIGIVYESRPNVTVDAAALCVMSGNAAILRGGSEATASNRALHAAFMRGLAAAGLPADAVQLVPTPDRAVVGAMLAAAGVIDLLVPRGGKSLVARVQADARVPVLAHLDGINHVYVDASADPAMAEAVVFDAKMRRTGVCGAMETLLVDRDYPRAAGAARQAGGGGMRGAGRPGDDGARAGVGGGCR